ncbi:MAG: response regulator, partial [Cyanothece sp. SIO1E1]|nr:response regulator [Cyanothece sp. SIO1E1]
SDRIEVLRRGGYSCLEPSVTPTQIMAAVTHALRQSIVSPKVMIVDDDPELLEGLSTLLQPWGFEFTTLDDPLQFWDVLPIIAPDLLILDVEMPDVNGIELCQLIRGDPHWSKLPVLFLSAHTDAKTQHQAFTAGADDYVSKPVIAAELATRMLNRWQRVCRLREEENTDHGHQTHFNY